MLREYTEKFEGFQIRDINYVGGAPDNAPIKFDVVVWKKNEYNDEPKEYCYSVANLIYDEKEPGFELRSVGMRWVDAHPSTRVENWIKAWCDYKMIELEKE